MYLRLSGAKFITLSRIILFLKLYFKLTPMLSHLDSLVFSSICKFAFVEYLYFFECASLYAKFNLFSIQIEDHGFSSSFFPFLVAEEDVCSEIRMLEGALEFTETDADFGETEKMEAKNQATDFVHEMGWLLHRSQLKSRLGHLNPSMDLFPLRRFNWLMEFSMDHEWCAVVRKLLNILHNGIVCTGDQLSLNEALSEMGLLHRAVRRNSRSLVELLLRYVPDKFGSKDKALDGGSHESILFRPDVIGPAGLTPLHIAAGKDGSEDVLDALTEDPGMVILFLIN